MSSLVEKIAQRPKLLVGVAFLFVLIAAGLGLAGRELWATYHFRAGQEALRLHKLEKARKHLNHCLKVWPNSYEAHFMAARAARRSGVYDEATVHLTKCQELNGGITGPIQFERTLLRAAVGDLASVEKELWTYVTPRVDPSKDPPAEEVMLIWECLGACYMAQFRPGTALYCFSKVLEKDDKNILALHGRAWVFERMSNFTEAENAIRKVLDLDPDDEKAKIHLAQVLYATSRAPDAIKLFEEVYPRHRDDPMVVVGIARCKEELGQTDEAARILDDFLEKNPKHAEALTQRGKIAFQGGEGALAEKFLRRAVEAEPFNRQSNHTLYLCLNQQGKEKEAQELLPKLQRIEADIERLMEISNKEMDPRPNDPQLTYEIGAILLRNGQVHYGLYWLEKALQLNPRHEPTIKTLMEYYQSINKKAMAEQYKQMLTPAGQ